MHKARYLVSLFVFVLPASATAQTTTTIPSYGWLLVKTTFVLIGICALAFAGLKWLSKIQSRANHGKMTVLAKLPIEPRRSIFVVKIGQRGLIVGSSETGMASLGELTPTELAEFEPEPESAVVDVDLALSAMDPS